MSEERIALLEFDSNKESVIMPGHEKAGFRLPEVAVFAFVREAVDEYAKDHGLTPVGFFETITMIFPVYVDKLDGKEIAFCMAPLGGPAAAQYMDWLISYGVKKVIATGSCGVLKDIPENYFLVPSRALRDEGTSFHYMAPSRYVETDKGLNKVIEEYFLENNLHYEEVTTWTTDGFFRETADKVKSRVEEGCTCVDMECASLAACAKLREVQFSQIFFTADSLADTSEYNERDWGVASLRPALEMCIKIAKRA